MKQIYQFTVSSNSGIDYPVFAKIRSDLPTVVEFDMNHSQTGFQPSAYIWLYAKAILLGKDEPAIESALNQESAEGEPGFRIFFFDSCGKYRNIDKWVVTKTVHPFGDKLCAYSETISIIRANKKVGGYTLTPLLAGLCLRDLILSSWEESGRGEGRKTAPFISKADLEDWVEQMKQAYSFKLLRSYDEE